MLLSQVSIPKENIYNASDREINEEMGKAFSSGLRKHGHIGYWGNTAVFVGIVSGLSRTKHFQKKLRNHWSCFGSFESRYGVWIAHSSS